jgi:hypothetical protein
MSPAHGSSLPQYPIPPIPQIPVCENSRSGTTCVPDYSQVPRAQWDNYGWCEEEQRFVCCQPADICNDDGSLFIPKGLVKSINQVRKERGQSVAPTTEIDLNVWTGSGLYASRLSEKMQKVADGNWEGLGYPSRSEAGFALLCALGGLSDCNRYVMREDFEATKFCSEVWADKWYRDDKFSEQQLDRAIKYVETHEQKPQTAQGEKVKAPVVLRFKSMADVKPEAIDWLWKGYLATGNWKESRLEAKKHELATIAETADLRKQEIDLDAKIIDLSNQYIENLYRLSWKWRKRSSVKIAERTYEKRTEALYC